jgi:hypothetical protein
MNRIVPLLFLLLAAAAQAGTCKLVSQTCAVSGCRNFTASDGSTACVCTKGSSANGCLSSTASCWDMRDTYSCPNPLANCLSDPDCKLVSQTCTGTDANGQCTQYLQTYQCSKQVKVCTQYQQVNSCVNVQTNGLENQPAQTNTGGFDQAMKAAGMLDAIAKGMSGTNPPTVFAGKLEICKQQYNCGGINFQQCCCDINLKRSGGFLGCSADEAELAGARRAHLTHALENCCAQRLPLLGCVVHEESYCAFDSMLGRIIQEQGRDQLAAMAGAGNATLSNSAIPTFSLYGTGSGAWLGPYTVNGNRVWVWQWPAACAGSSGMNCPSAKNQLWWMSCSGTSCASPSAAPPANPPETSGLLLTSTDAGSPPSVSLGRTMAVTGSCGTGTNPGCSYTVSAYTAGTGIVTSDVGWTLYNSASGWSAPTMLGDAWQLSGYSLPLSASPAAGGSAPSSVTIQYGPASGGAMTTTTLLLSIPATAPVSLGSTGIAIWGSCLPPYYQCSYRATSSYAVKAKPWDAGCSGNGDPVNPDCSGFTLTQFMLLDLSKMDLSEWIATVSASVNTGALSAQANSQAQAKQSGGPYSTQQPATYDTSGTNQTPLKLSAGSCELGVNCSITAMASANWSDPTQGNDSVSSVDLDWGDGNKQHLTGKTTVNGATFFQAVHVYGAVGNYVVTAIYHASSGDHRAAGAVQVWQDTPPTDQGQQNTNGGTTLIPP